MATDLLKNIKIRTIKAGEIGNFPDWYITELLGFKKRWSTDMLVDITDPKNPSKKKTESFKIVRVWHRSPDNSWIYGGGCRYHPDVTLSQMESHAMEMSYKGWIMGIPHGGAKGGDALDPTQYSEADLIAITCKTVEEAVEAGVIGPYTDRWAPDVGTNEIIMKWIQDQFSYEMRKMRTPQPAATVTGKPVRFGGMQGRKEATGRGLHNAFQIFRRILKPKLPEQPTAILEGCGNVGFHFAKLASEFGIKIVGVLDKYGGVYHPNLPINELLTYVEQNPKKTVAGFHEICKGDPISTQKELYSLRADIAVPAALEGSITPEIAEDAKYTVQLEGANGPTLPEADPILEEKNIIVIPDIFANAGGYLVSYFEWAKDTRIEPFDPLLELPRTNDEGLVFKSMVEAFNRNGEAIIRIQQREKDGNKNISYRLASYLYAMWRVFEIAAMKRRKHFSQTS